MAAGLGNPPKGSCGRRRRPGRNHSALSLRGLPKFGLSAAQLAVSREHLIEDLSYMREALAMSDIEAGEHNTAPTREVVFVKLFTGRPPTTTLRILALWGSLCAARGNRKSGQRKD